MADHPPHHRSSMSGPHPLADTLYSLNQAERQLLDALINKQIRIPLWHQIINNSPPAERADLITRYAVILRTSDQAVDAMAFEKTIMDLLAAAARAYVESAIQTVSLLELQDAHLCAIRGPTIYPLLAAAFPTELLAYGGNPQGNTCEYCAELGHYYYNCRLYYCAGCLLPQPGHTVTNCPNTVHAQNNSDSTRPPGTGPTDQDPGEGTTTPTAPASDPFLTTPLPGTPHPASRRTLRRSRPMVLSGVNPQILIRGPEEIQPTNQVSRVWAVGELSPFSSEGSEERQSNNHSLSSLNTVPAPMVLDPNIFSRAASTTSSVSPDRYDTEDPLALRVLTHTLQIPTLSLGDSDLESTPGTPPAYRGSPIPDAPPGPPGTPNHWYQGTLGPL